MTRRRWSLLKSKANATKPRKHTAPKKKPRLIRRSSTCLTPYVIRQSSSSIRTKTVPRALIKIMLQINVTTSKLNLRDNAVFKSMVQLNEAVKAALASCTIGGMSLYTFSMSSPKYTSESSKGGRLASLNAMSRAIVLNALMKRNLSLNHKKQMLVANIFLSSYGPMMSELKDILDSGGEYHTLPQAHLARCLVHADTLADTKDDTPRSDIYKSQKSHNPQIKIVCDMDDTLICSGGRWPAGLDRQIPRGTAYPGALQFYAAIAERTQLRFGDDSRDEDDTFPCSDSEDSAPPSPSTRATASSFLNLTMLMPLICLIVVLLLSTKTKAPAAWTRTPKNIL